jgi:ubiquinone/menaquinone biosynthesis C-methylase UbiE
MLKPANTLRKWVELNERISLHQRRALTMPFTESSFDGAYMLHVGMNIDDKERLASEAV